MPDEDTVITDVPQTPETAAELSKRLREAGNTGYIDTARFDPPPAGQYMGRGLISKVAPMHPCAVMHEMAARLDERAATLRWFTQHFTPDEPLTDSQRSLLFHCMQWAQHGGDF